MNKQQADKVTRKAKWRNVVLNEVNIDEYLQDLYVDTKGNYIFQSVSFNKNDSHQMTLLRNALIVHGSFSAFVRSLMYKYFETNGQMGGEMWQPNMAENTAESDVNSSDSAPSLIESQEVNKVAEQMLTQAQEVEEVEPIITQAEDNSMDEIETTGTIENLNVKKTEDNSIPKVKRQISNYEL